MIQYPIHGSKYFDVREWVDRRTFGILGHLSANLIEVRQVRITDLFREKIGVPVFINDWHIGGPYDSSGFRAVWDKTGGLLSQHRRGCASDMKAKGFTPKQMLGVVMDNKAEFIAAGLTTIEDINFTPTWLHLDSRPLVPGQAPEGGFLFVKPSK